MEITLSSEADKLLQALYKKYKSRRKDKLPKSKAKSFGSSQSIHEQLLPKWKLEDIDDACRELSRAKIVKCLWADDTVYRVWLSDDGIAYYENRNKNLIKEARSFVVDLVLKTIAI